MACAIGTDMPVLWNYSEEEADHPKVNMYGFTPCPECSSRFRYWHKDYGDIVDCPDCGYSEQLISKQEEDNG
jgi:uncharacterized metal-binding protein (TIGR02443 family)